MTAIKIPSPCSLVRLTSFALQIGSPLLNLALKVSGLQIPVFVSTNWSKLWFHIRKVQIGPGKDQVSEDLVKPLLNPCNWHSITLNHRVYTVLSVFVKPTDDKRNWIYFEYPNLLINLHKTHTILTIF